MHLYTILCTETTDGIVALKENPAVSEETLLNIFQWKRSGVERSDILERLRMQTVPAGYIPKTWSALCQK